MRNHGNVDGALGSAAKRVSADYFVPHLAHAQMEVPNAIAHWVANTCETWSPTQNPTQVRQTVAQVLGINETDVTRLPAREFLRRDPCLCLAWLSATSPRSASKRGSRQ